jgi:hypothetical protein
MEPGSDPDPGGDIPDPQKLAQLLQKKGSNAI